MIEVYIRLRPHQSSDLAASYQNSQSSDTSEEVSDTMCEIPRNDVVRAFLGEP